MSRKSAGNSIPSPDSSPTTRRSKRFSTNSDDTEFMFLDKHNKTKQINFHRPPSDTSHAQTNSTREPSVPKKKPAANNSSTTAKKPATATPNTAIAASSQQPDSAPKQRGRKPKSRAVVEDSSDIEVEPVNTASVSSQQSSTSPKRRGRKPKPQVLSEDKDSDADVTFEDKNAKVIEEAVFSPKTPKKSATVIQKEKRKREEVLEDDDQSDSNSIVLDVFDPKSPAKKSKKSTTTATTQANPPSKSVVTNTSVGTGSTSSISRSNSKTITSSSTSTQPVNATARKTNGTATSKTTPAAKTQTTATASPVPSASEATIRTLNSEIALLKSQLAELQQQSTTLKEIAINSSTKQDEKLAAKYEKKIAALNAKLETANEKVESVSGLLVKEKKQRRELQEFVKKNFTNMGVNLDGDDEDAEGNNGRRNDALREDIRNELRVEFDKALHEATAKFDEQKKRMEAARKLVDDDNVKLKGEVDQLKRGKGVLESEISKLKEGIKALKIRSDKPHTNENYLSKMELSVRMYEDITGIQIQKIESGIRLPQIALAESSSSSSSESAAAPTNENQVPAIIYNCTQRIKDTAVSYNLETAKESVDFYTYFPQKKSNGEFVGGDEGERLVEKEFSYMKEDIQFDREQAYAWFAQMNGMLAKIEKLKNQ